MVSDTIGSSGRDNRSCHDEEEIGGNENDHESFPEQTELVNPSLLATIRKLTGWQKKKRGPFKL